MGSVFFSSANQQSQVHNTYPRLQNNQQIKRQGDNIQIQSYNSLIKINQIGQKYNGFVTSEGNVIWAGALNLAFNDFKKEFLNQKDLKFVQNKPAVNRLLKPLNNARFTRSNIQQNAVYVKSGYGNQVIRKINKQISQKFPYKSIPPLKQDMNDSDYISYAYLIKALSYEHPFQRQAGIIWFGQRQQHDQEDCYMVEAFGAISEQSKKQIKIIQYQNGDNFFVGFKANSLKNKKMIGNTQVQISKQQPNNKQNQELSWVDKIRNFFRGLVSSNNQQQMYNTLFSDDVIYILSERQKDQINEIQSSVDMQSKENSLKRKQSKKSQSNKRQAGNKNKQKTKKKALTIDDVIQKVMRAQKTPIDQRPSHDRLVQFTMPVIDLDIKHKYEEFEGLQIDNKQLKGNRLKICENIKLRMDQKGVVVENDAFICKDECAVMGNIQINIQYPFWLVLTQEGKHPYLVVKINFLPKKQINFQS